MTLNDILNTDERKELNRQTRPDIPEWYNTIEDRNECCTETNARLMRRARESVHYESSAYLYGRQILRCRTCGLRWVQ